MKLENEYGDSDAKSNTEVHSNWQDIGKLAAMAVEKSPYVTYRQRSGTGLTINGTDVLSAISRAKAPSLTFREIAKRARCSAQTVRRCVNDLERLGRITYVRLPDGTYQFEVLKGGAA